MERQRRRREGHRIDGLRAASRHNSIVQRRNRCGGICSLIASGGGALEMLGCSLGRRDAPTDIEGWEDGAHGGVGAADRDAELGKRSEAEDSVLVPPASCIVREGGI